MGVESLEDRANGASELVDRGGWCHVVDADAGHEVRVERLEETRLGAEVSVHGRDRYTGFASHRRD
jgi:hypothetical protein